MKTKIFLIALTILTILACKKGQYTTKPQLTLKDGYPTSLNQGDQLTFHIEFTDAEGDIQDSIWIERISKVCNTNNFISPLKYAIPTFDTYKNLKGTFEISFTYDNKDLKTCFIPSVKSDTSMFRFWVRDKAGHISDTVASKFITLVK